MPDTDDPTRPGGRRDEPGAMHDGGDPASAEAGDKGAPLPSAAVTEAQALASATGIPRLNPVDQAKTEAGSQEPAKE